MAKRGNPNMTKGNKLAVGHGRPKLSAFEREVKYGLREHIARAAALLFMTRAEIKELVKKNKETPCLSMLEEMTLEKIRQGQMKTIESTIITRLLGKPKEIVETTHSHNLSVDLTKLSDYELDKLEHITMKITGGLDYPKT